MTRTDIQQNGKIVGVYDSDEKKYFTIRKPQHFMVKYNGFGISKKILLYLQKVGCHFISIRYMGKKGDKYYTYTVEEFLASDKQFTFEEEDLQHFMSIYKKDPQRQLW